MSTRPEDLLFLGTHGNVTAVRKTNGRRVWTSSLPGTGYSIVSLVFEDGVLYAGSKGLLFALDPTNGEILWKNGLKNLGYGHMIIATTRQATDLATLHAQLDSDASSNSAGSGAGAAS